MPLQLNRGLHTDIMSPCARWKRIINAHIPHVPQAGAMTHFIGSYSSHIQTHYPNLISLTEPLRNKYHKACLCVEVQNDIEVEHLKPSGVLYIRLMAGPYVVTPIRLTLSSPKIWPAWKGKFESWNKKCLMCLVTDAVWNVNVMFEFVKLIPPNAKWHCYIFSSISDFL